MVKLIDYAGNAAALLGILVCVVSGVSRLMGNWHTMGYSSMTLFTVGIALMVLACLAKLHVLSAK
jgi:type IV secretory pathway VirB2 component (pilin)